MTPPSSSSSGRKSASQAPPDPPRADMIDECPPHHWVIASGRQKCRKCALDQEVPAMTDTRTTTWQRRNTTKTDATNSTADSEKKDSKADEKKAEAAS